MPKRTDIHSILIIGAGPIIIGQACEFDYSGTQACKALKEEGYRVILVNSNPATIMTDPEFADRTYIEPITPETVEKIIAREKEGMNSLGRASGRNVSICGAVNQNRESERRQCTGRSQWAHIDADYLLSVLLCRISSQTVHCSRRTGYARRVPAAGVHGPSARTIQLARNT